MQRINGRTAKNTNAMIRQPDLAVYISWDRSKSEEKTFFTIGTSTIGGLDIIQGDVGVLTQPDYFNYTDVTDRVISYSIDKEVLEPLSGIGFTRGNLILDNTDGLYEYIQPSRPIKIFAGFKDDSGSDLYSRVYALSEQPKLDRRRGILSINFLDYVSYINDYQLESTKYVDQRSDEIIADILDTIGFATGQYELDEGLNNIGFAYFPKGTKAGDAIRQIATAEEGRFFQTDEGLIKFENRRRYITSPKTDTSWVIDADKIIDWIDDDSNIINYAEVKAEPLEVQAQTEIWLSGADITIPQGTTEEVWIEFENPVNTIVDLEATTDYIVADGGGNTITSLVDIVLDKFTTGAKLTITNNFSGDAIINYLRLRGTPAVAVASIKEFYQDDDSIETFGTKAIYIENDFIRTQSFAYYLARALVRKYKNGVRSSKVVVPYIPFLQVGDKLSVQDPFTLEYIDMRLMRIQEIYSKQTLFLREITSTETDSPFIIGTSVIGGDDVIVI